MATQMEEFEASTQLLVQQVELLIAKVSAMVGTEDEQAAAHAADALAAKNAALAAAAAANDTLVAIQALDANQIVIDVAQVLAYKNAAEAAAAAAAQDLAAITQRGTPGRGSGNFSREKILIPMICKKRAPLSGAT